MKIHHILLYVLLFSGNLLNAQKAFLNDGPGYDTVLFKVLFYINDTLQLSKSEIYFIDSVRNRMIRPDEYICDTSKSTLYYKDEFEKRKVSVVFINGNTKIIIPNFQMYSTTTEIEFGVITEPQKLIKVYSQVELDEMDAIEKFWEESSFYSPKKRNRLYFPYLSEKVKYIQYAYIESNSIVGPLQFRKYIIKDDNK